jgi:16S rRNA processing protein RimM
VTDHSTSSSRPDGLLEVGRFGRPHGVKGQIYLKLTTNRDERVRRGARLWAGEWFEVISGSPMFSTGPDRWVVTLAGVSDRNACERLVNRVVWAEPIADPDAVWVHEAIGADVVDLSGNRHGRCVAVVANPANDLLELESGALVPVNFVLSVRANGAGGFTALIDPPAGLFEIFDEGE